jgi:hypothetical protein
VVKVVNSTEIHNLVAFASLFDRKLCTKPCMKKVVIPIG